MWICLHCINSKSDFLIGNNVYGSDGYYMAGAAGITVPVYLQSISLSSSAYGGDASYAVIDNPSNVPNNVNSGLFFRTNTFGTVISFTVSSTLVGSKSFRVGILNNNQGHSSNDNSGLTPDFIAVNQTSGGSATSGTLDSSSTPTPFQARAHWIFFDISGAVANDTFAINIGSDGAPQQPNRDWRADLRYHTRTNTDRIARHGRDGIARATSAVIDGAPSQLAEACHPPDTNSKVTQQPTGSAVGCMFWSVTLITEP